ncbi:MAG: EscU/YscU/HrcU family type III secretion system export apparatus switch protein [Candidatus Eremiobacteraeota bacterium]|nr:EscU/YscU/HrcU family type III secretion system export apparatus switch protein [Candidatus Eremiobacteraeota bacterium]
MSAGGGEKQFDATPARIAKAKREGNIARSQEFGSTIALAAAACSLLGIVRPIGGLAHTAIEAAASGRVSVGYSIAILLCACLPAAAAAVAGSAAAIVQSGGVHVVAIVPKFERLNPVENLKRMLSREAATHATRACAAFLLAAIAIAPSIRDVFATLASNDGPLRVADVAWRGTQHVIFAATAIGGTFAVAEYGVARRAWLQKLKMSFEEFKRDLKEHDGDPATRGRRKSLHRELVRGAIAKVKEASFVVVNPTHVAVALQYRPPEIPVPVALVCAVDETALRVRELAAQYHIPVVENVALARALLRDARPGDTIPHAHYVAVAQIVAALVRSGALEGR